MAILKYWKDAVRLDYKWHQWIVDTDNRVFGTKLKPTHLSLMIYKDDGKQEILMIDAKCFMMISRIVMMSPYQEEICVVSGCGVLCI